ncbi:hypothetical protein RhiirA5_185525 [Rhizophagus irregularis]|uniref:Uncharacterized protein n=4 Tax=Rhizophagus irregularis TaxID=588596 RepID=A0A2I1DVJ7_9GLOM|nr:hypothetical protein GLOIN_2v1487494 [Rhizophagus irregularis DAOM 181602=DAOM 197198]EXX76869.1 hypothetical protein RirG_029050 [Rhizophagus irregularis DAOM 197198w]PKC07792.1 hypothetical protein RhiirA5_185525 [Rhizophagus irregularis]PKY13896.1 hypothetical protein RhiirB3_168373 [Rhizophagus irregularis]POG59853.1 hypothetical protein GLOIN_2v1487494 [Rhizophagus irregularis DAOM 181602=DAOM 197198]CAB5216317.1 unnamed protein product [Rhizophagus irregularis]|eukprot:XP_025166719.1 hypothetical protein GLOIN_2v1487494 [Rhizophagus irregularis DAOM 181602=DAOM 197198]
MAAIMAAFAASTPLPSDYLKSDSRMFFSYHPENTSFQKGYLGIGVTTISGTLHIRFPHAVAAKFITLNFIGRETVEWVDLKKIRAERIIIDKSYKLWESSTELGHELITDLDLPFDFEIPEDAIGSFQSQFGKVQYTLRATIYRKPRRKKHSIEVLVPLSRWTIPTDQEIRPLVIKSHARHRKVPISWQAVLPQTFFDVNSEALIKLKLTSQKPDLRVRKISTCLKTFVQYFVDGRPEERQRLHSKHVITGNDVMMTPVGTNTTFEANTMIRIPSNVPPTGKTKYMSIRNQIQIKVTFERSRHNVMITREIIVGRNFLNDSSAADMRDSMDYFSDSEFK